MATTLGANSVAGDMLVFEALINKAYPRYKRRNIHNLLANMVRDGTVQMDALLEKAISQEGNLQRESRDGWDFADRSDAKKAITQYVQGSTPGTALRRRALISNVAGKDGKLRCMVSETISKKVYYFKIPRSAYRGMNCISIYFTEHGEPKRSGKWWNYECKNLQELST
jgi:hypothetical protein